MAVTIQWEEAHTGSHASLLATGRKRGAAGQMTVELAVALPVLIAVAAMAFNLCAFIADCAVFDRSVHEAVRVHATSPAYRQNSSQSCSYVKRDVDAALGSSDIDVDVSSQSAGLDFVRFTATMKYSPTLFGLGLRTQVFGIGLPRLSHSTSYVVDVYKPGVVV